MRKNEGFVFHGTARVIRLINSLLYDKNENIPDFHREFADNFPKKYFKISFLRSSIDFQIFRKLSENSPRISRKIIAHEFYQKHFPEYSNFPKYSENIKKILVNVRVQFC